MPILEELFWRGWMMRWLIDSGFQKVPLGNYVPSAFWLVAVLFASEHGPYWEVGFVAGIIYNWWMVRTRNLADCIWLMRLPTACWRLTWSRVSVSGNTGYNRIPVLSCVL